MIQILGAGLAGCEAALQAADFGVPVLLYEMKPILHTPAHHLDSFAELVCSNSFRAARVENAVGLLKCELMRLGSHLMRIASQCSVPAGGALAVDRDEFATAVTQAIHNHPNITVRTECVQNIPREGIVVVATGPLTQGSLFDELQEAFGQEHCHFFDAAAPIVTRESLDFSVVFAQSRYDRGGADYLNCPMNEQEYRQFYHSLIQAEQAEVEAFDREVVFEGCMPIEVMARRGEDTMRFGPLKPVGLIDPRTGKRPYACVQLRQDDRQGNLYNLVGFQTRLKQGEQRRVFGMIPGLQNAQFMRYGVMHRNTYIHSPGHLNACYQWKQNPRVYFAGQMTGVEGYVESIASGLIAGINAALAHRGEEPFVAPATTVIGSMAAYISDPAIRQFQPMNANFGLLPPLPERLKKQQKIAAWIQRAVSDLEVAIQPLEEREDRGPFGPEIPLEGVPTYWKGGTHENV